MANIAEISKKICNSGRYPLQCRPYSGCGAVWLARLTGGQEVAGSSPVTPIVFGEIEDYERNNFPFCSPIAPHLRLLLNRGILNVEQLRLAVPLNPRNQIQDTLGPQIREFISCTALGGTPRSPLPLTIDLLFPRTICVNALAVCGFGGFHDGF